MRTNEGRIQCRKDEMREMRETRENEERKVKTQIHMTLLASHFTKLSTAGKQTRESKQGVMANFGLWW
jgi:hypothetical protein